MADLPGMPSTIRCTACGFENTTTSLYCQDCGARLVAPPSAIAEEQPELATSPAPPASKARPARILSINRPRAGLKLLAITLRTLLLAALLAFVAVVLLPPANLPPKAAALAPDVIQNVRTALQRSAQMRKPLVVPWGNQGLNAYLAGVLTPSAANSGYVLLSGARLAPAPLPDTFTLFIERRILGVPLYTSTSYQLVTRGGGVSLDLTGAAVGRLPLPGWLAPSAELTNDAVTRALTPELQLLRSAKTVRTTPEKVFVNFGDSFQ